MRIKIDDAEWDARRMKRQFFVSKVNYRKTIKRNSIVDRVFKRILKVEMEKLWKHRKEQNVRKVAFLNKKWKSVSANPIEEKQYRGVKFRDTDINVGVNDRNEDALVYGEADVNNNMTSALTLNPKMMVFNKISETDLEVEIEKGIVKQRYECMKNEK